MASGSHWFQPALGAAVLPAAVALGALCFSIAGSAEGATVVVNEVQYDPAPGGGETGYEWIELLNTGTATVSLAGWSVADNRSSDALPDEVLAPGAFLVVAGSEAFRELFPDYDGRLVVLGGSIGNGLGNGGDRVVLLDAAGARVDAMSYGDDAEILAPTVALAASGHSLERVPAGVDTDTAADWVDQPQPSPGAAASQGSRTQVPVTHVPPTTPPGAGAVLNEYLPAPRDVDWDGDGQATAGDEWIELHNPGQVEIDLRGWQLDDVEGGGSNPFVVTEDIRIAPGGHALVFQRDSGIVLNNDRDEVRLLRPDGSVADATTYRSPRYDASYARQGDGTGPWSDALPPTPGEANPGAESSPPPPPTRAQGATATATSENVPSTVPGTPASDTPSAPPGDTPGPEVTPTWSPTPDGTSPWGTPGAPGTYLPYVISEVLFDPALPGNDAADEWVEIHNPTDVDGLLAGWSIGDRAASDPLPSAVIPARGFVVVAASDPAARSLASLGATVVVVDDGAIGNGLANGGDIVRLRGPTGAEADAVSYGGNLDAFDPSVPGVASGWSIERVPPGFDTDSALDWWPQPVPSPGRAGTIVTGPARVRLNEVLPAPSRVDWDGDGIADHRDEWIELVNAGDAPADLVGWRLENRGANGGWSHRLADGTVLAPGDYLLIHRASSGLALVNDGDEVRLLRDDGMAADVIAYAHSPGYDRSWARMPDADGPWAEAREPTPGRANRARSHPPRSSSRSRSSAEAPAPTVPIAQARALSSGTRVALQGRLTATTAAFGPREAYLGDENAGIKLYLADRGGRFPDAVEGARALATGTLKDYHGERELVVADAADLWIDASVAPAPVPPAEATCGGLGESVEGRLVRIVGRVVERRGSAFTVRDGTGTARVVVRRATSIGRPALSVGVQVSVTGIAGQYAEAAPWVGGERLQPRWPSDIVVGGSVASRSVPGGLPRTGRSP